MLAINDERFIKRAEIIREKGTNRSAFFRGEVDKYGWVDIGSSFLPSEIIAAFLYALYDSHKCIIITTVFSLFGALLAQITVTGIALRTPIGYGRIFFFMDLYLLIVISVVFTWIGSITRLSAATSFIIASAIIFTLIFLSVSEGVQNIGKARSFTKLYDQRIDTLLSLNKLGNKQNAYFDSLPYSGILAIPDLEREGSTGRIPYSYYSIRKYYSLNFNAFLKP